MRDADHDAARGSYPAHRVRVSPSQVIERAVAGDPEIDRPRHQCDAEDPVAFGALGVEPADFVAAELAEQIAAEPLARERRRRGRVERRAGDRAARIVTVAVDRQAILRVAVWTLERRPAVVAARD